MFVKYSTLLRSGRESEKAATNVELGLGETPPGVTSLWHKTQWMVPFITAIRKAVD
jgi:hypothetical protein